MKNSMKQSERVFALILALLLAVALAPVLVFGQDDSLDEEAGAPAVSELSLDSALDLPVQDTAVEPEYITKDHESQKNPDTDPLIPPTSADETVEAATRADEAIVTETPHRI